MKFMSILKRALYNIDEILFGSIYICINLIVFDIFDKLKVLPFGY